MSNYILFMSAVIIGQIGLRILQRNQSIPFQQAGSESWEKHLFKQKETYRNLHSPGEGRPSASTGWGEGKRERAGESTNSVVINTGEKLEALEPDIPAVRWRGMGQMGGGEINL